MDEAAQYDYAAFLRAITLLAMMLDACLRLGTSGVGISPSAMLLSGVTPRHAEAAARQDRDIAMSSSCDRLDTNRSRRALR